MDMTELNQRRVEAEIAKITAETEVLRRHRWPGLTEFVKVTGAIVATIAGLYAAITTYRITQLETRLAVTEREQAEKERASAVAAKDRAKSELATATKAKLNAELELNSLLAALEKARTDLGEANRRSDLGALARVSGNLESASERASRSLPYVYIVPATANQLDEVVRISSAISTNGIRVGVSRPLREMRNAPSQVELHFFKLSDRSEAERIVSLLRESSINTTAPVYVTRPEIQRLRYYELRLPLNNRAP
jgi:hypothetical protein